MESTSSEAVWQEQTKSSVSKKCVQEVSAISVQKLSLSSTSSLVGQQSVLSILGSGSDGGIVANQIAATPAVESSLPLPSPIITSPSLPDNSDDAVNTTNIQNEFSAMKLKDEQGNEIGEIVQQKQEQETHQTSKSVTSVRNESKSTSSVKQVSSSTTTSSKLQQSATSIEKAQESSSSSSVSCSSYSSTKKQEIVSSSTRSLSSIKSSQSIEKVMHSSTAVVEDQEF